ncbi:galanin peptides-like [Myxocyprinus asiaticus]|uniref:galanin peptides-like n=1 Tax=Myxocyprinus asiaticus TaxID=70543 RepID=UPI002221A5D1|nr:galanin peptides-like [Myxocyprinus asiaticus]
MKMSYAVLCVSLCVFTAHLSSTHGMTLMIPEKKGWTLNSAGYLLGPYAHGSLNVRHRATMGKRDVWNEHTNLPTYNDSYLLSLLGHLADLRLKEIGITEDFISGHMKE